jgi:hypothetical protein
LSPADYNSRIKQYHCGQAHQGGSPSFNKTCKAITTAPEQPLVMYTSCHPPRKHTIQTMHKMERVSTHILRERSVVKGVPFRQSDSSRGSARGVYVAVMLERSARRVTRTLRQQCRQSDALTQYTLQIRNDGLHENIGSLQVTENRRVACQSPTFNASYHTQASSRMTTAPSDSGMMSL